MKWLAALILALQTVTSAGADEVKLWKKVGNWFIVIDQSLESSCFAGRTYNDSFALRIGLLTPSVTGPMYLAVGSTKWPSIETGEMYQISVRIDNGRARQLNFVGQDINGMKFLVSSIREDALLAELISRNAIRFAFEGNEIARLSLSGSRRAITELLPCQNANLGDPFAKR